MMRLSALLLLAALVGGCDLFPKRLYLEAEDGGAFGDGGAGSALTLAETCVGEVPVVEVDEATGLAKVIGHGEGAITAWYSGQITLARITSPWPSAIPDDVYSQTPRRNVIDDAVLGQLRRLNLKPSPRSSDSEFIRRVRPRCRH